jgi:hypothetical protein
MKPGVVFWVVKQHNQMPNIPKKLARIFKLLFKKLLRKIIVAGLLVKKTARPPRTVG